jgi:pilus assembly protein Flp/PilA
MTGKLAHFLADETAATAVEYVLVVSLIAAAVMVAVGNLGDGVQVAFDSISRAVTNAVKSM